MIVCDQPQRHSLNISKTQQRKNILIRRARSDETDDIAKLYRRTAGAEWPFLFPHTPEEDRVFFRKAFERGVVWVATEEDLIVGFCALRTGWLDHLFVMHERHGSGIGQALVAVALRGRQRVRLWTFQRNARSRRFYALQGFREIRLTDGRANEEKEPDVLLEWRRPPN
jgi:putative acetyltransferase